MKSYINYFKVRFAVNLQYRSAAVSGVITQLFFGLIFVMVYIALFRSNTSANVPMNLAEIVTYIWLGQAFFSLTYPYEKDQELITMIKNGNLAYELIRPQDFYLKFYVKIYAKRIVFVLLRFLPIFIIGFLLPVPYNMTVPSSGLHFLYFAIALLLSSILVNALTMLVHIITIFLLDPRGIFGIYSVVAELFMGSLVPIPLLPGFLQKVAAVLPFRYMSDIPYRLYTGNISISSGSYYILLSFIWIIAIVLIGYKLTKLALKKAVIQGG